eukprot:gene31819-42441_t
MTDILIEGGRTLVDGSLADTSLQVAGTDIAAVGSHAARTALTIDASGLLVLPGIVDIHGDAFERQMMPRPGVDFPIDVALIDSDRQVIANGITTVFHGTTCSWEPGLRSADNARGLLEAIEALRPRLAADTRFHLRHETYNLDAEEMVVSQSEIRSRLVLDASTLRLRFVTARASAGGSGVVGGVPRVLNETAQQDDEPDADRGIGAGGLAEPFHRRRAIVDRFIAASKLDQLRQMTTVVADTGDIEAVRRLAPVDCTTNPTLILKAVETPAYADLVDEAIVWGRKAGRGADTVHAVCDRLAVTFGAELTKIVPGRVSTEVDADLSFDTKATIDKARALIAAYRERGIEKDRILVKIASTSARSRPRITRFE